MTIGFSVNLFYLTFRGNDMGEHYYSENPTTKHAEQEFVYMFGGKKYRFSTDSGVFSKNRVDYGTALLIEHAVIKPGSKVLDLAAGYGPIGIVLASKLIQGQLTMADINTRAVQLLKTNVIRNADCIPKDVSINIVGSDGFMSIAENDFDYIFLNPPIRAGKTTVFRLYREAHIGLKQGGELWIVIRKKQGASSTTAELENLYSNVEVVAKSKGYFIIKSTK